MITKHPVKKWEVSIAEYTEFDGKKRWKVTRRVPEMGTADTEVFDSKEEAVRQYEEWLL